MEEVQQPEVADWNKDGVNDFIAGKRMALSSSPRVPEVARLYGLGRKKTCFTALMLEPGGNTAAPRWWIGIKMASTTSLLAKRMALTNTRAAPFTASLMLDTDSATDFNDLTVGSEDGTLYFLGS